MVGKKKNITKKVRKRTVGKRSIKRRTIRKKIKRDSLDNYGFFKRNYILSFRYLGQSWRFFAFIFVIFLISCLFGYFFPFYFTDFIRKFLQELTEKTAGMSMLQIILFILKNNLMSSFVSMLAGIFLGIFPVITTFINGYVLGFISNKTVALQGHAILLRLLPHGIFEIPAIIISLGLGIKLGMFIFYKEKRKYIVENLENCLRVFVFIVLPALILASIIEGALIFLL